MSEPFLAEIRIVGFNFAPRGWAFCDGQILPINQNQSLYSLLGTTYGGDGRTSFGLPELRGRTPMHVGPGFSLGQKSGEEKVTLTDATMPTHTHDLKATNAPASSSFDGPDGHVLAQVGINIYGDLTSANAADMAAGTVGNTGNGEGHENMSPWLALNFCIALRGLFPSRN